MDEDCLKLSAYFDERQRTRGRFLADVLLGIYEERRVATSIVLRGIAGFGSRHQLRSDQSLSLSEDPPSLSSRWIPGQRSRRYSSRDLRCRDAG
ncbi:hypothetical protein I553_7366 [Mycobacterium xenopi 4042]|uniref:Uncharacterized protein n=1 Tax=Mycobacterium xenopi 4042 TaxID=1299334 RepID=X8E913_MYCXE|nr:hypothetical protein I553_7366 [Mycobacterium xenopi 4042]